MNTNYNPELDLIIERITDVPREKLYKTWTTPELLMKWFCPPPWGVSECRMDLKPGGEFFTAMKSPEGDSYPTDGCFLEIIENKKLVWTSTMSKGYRPSLESGLHLTVTVTFEDHPEGTKYTAFAQHKNIEDKQAHEGMGFINGWNISFDQLVSIAKKM